MPYVTPVKTCQLCSQHYSYWWPSTFMSQNICGHSDGKVFVPFRRDGYSVNLKFNTLRPRQNGRHFPDDILKCIFLNENVWLSIKISWKFVPQGPINNIPALVQIMTWRRPGDKPLSEPMMVILLTHIWVTRPQWVKTTLQSQGWSGTETVICFQWLEFVEFL